MAGKRMRGRSTWPVVDRGLLFQRIRELDGVIDVYNVNSVVDHLRELYRDYGCKKLIPFTRCVAQSLEDYRHRQRRLKDKQKEGQDDDHEASNEATPSPRSPKRFKFESEDEDSVFESEVKPEFDLLKSGIREAYRKGTINRLEKEEDVREDGGKDCNLAKSAGNGVVTDASMGKLEEIGSQSESWKGKRGAMFKDFGGIKEILDELTMDVVIPLWHPPLTAAFGVKPTSGILLHGPPGCGKTRLAEAIANESGVPFYKISAPEVVSGVSGGSEENIRELFKKAHRTAPSIIFIDEIDAIGSKRDNLQREVEKRIVTQLMTCMDECHHVDGGEIGKASEDLSTKPEYVLVIGATNRPDSVDPALRRPGRFDREIFLGVPDENARREILAVLTEKLKLDGALDLSMLARATAGFVGADLAALVNKAGILAMRRTLIQTVSEIPAELMVDEKATWWRQRWTHDEIEKLKVSVVDFQEAAKLIQPSSRREGFSSIPAVKWEDVGGLDSLRKHFDRLIIQRIKNPEKYEAFGLTLEAGFLLYGPPGCGKTLIAKAVANEAGANFIHIKGPELLNKYVGESELAVRTLFGRARTCSPCILFFDEIDALTMRRGKDSDSVVDRVLTQLLIELDGADQRQGVFIIGATNRPEAVDPAFLRSGRLGEIMYVPLPSREERVLILKTLSRNKPLASEVDLSLIANDCENFSGADLSSLVNKAAMVALEEKDGLTDPSSSPAIIEISHFWQALSKITPSVSEKRRKYYDDLSKRFKPA
ncbi:cell division cycle 48C [Wolffia australiana]